MRKILFWVVAASLCGFFIAAGFFSYDPPSTDSNGFAPAAIYFKQGNGFTNPIYQRAYDVDNQARFVYHGPLYPLALAFLMPRADAYGAILITRLFNAASFLIGALFIYYVSFWREQTALGWIVSIVSLFALATVTWTDLRPESLASIFLGCGILTLYLTNTSIWSCALVGLCAGALMLTQPAIFLIASAALLMFWGWRFNLWQIAFNYLFVGLTAAVVVGAFFIFVYPFPFSDWIAGMRTHASIAFIPTDLSMVIPFLILTPNIPMAGIVLLYGIVIGIFYARLHKGRITCAPAFFIGAMGLILSLWFFTLSVATHNYVLAGVWPLVLGGIVYLSSDKEHSRAIISIVLLGILSLGAFRQVALFSFYLKHGVGLTEARSKFSDFAAKNPGIIATSDSMWTLSEDYSRMINALKGANDENLVKRPDFYVLQQYRSGNLDPPEIGGWQLLENGFLPAPRMFGIRVGNTPPGYQYAVYKKAND